ncbi:MAG: hypothetical protein HY669_01015 [Chloroflexi bacterium]|nr:hypothetical protein [Chloroflexota bacterium]
MNFLALHYVAFVFIAALGVIQAACARSGRRGLMFFGNVALCYLFCALAVIGAFWWFFSTGDRTLLNPRIEGSGLFFGFSTGMILAVATTFFISSFVNADRLAVGPSQPSGLDALREMTFFQAVVRCLGTGRRRHKPYRQ